MNSCFFIFCSMEFCFLFFFLQALSPSLPWPPWVTTSAAGTTTTRKTCALWTQALTSMTFLMTSSGWTSSTQMGSATSLGIHTSSQHQRKCCKALWKKGERYRQLPSALISAIIRNRFQLLQFFYVFNFRWLPLLTPTSKWTATTRFTMRFALEGSISRTRMVEIMRAGVGLVRKSSDCYKVYYLLLIKDKKKIWIEKSI